VNQGAEERPVALSKATVAWADYALIMKDFPNLVPKGTKADAVNGIIDKALLASAAFVSTRQLNLQPDGSDVGTITNGADGEPRKTPMMTTAIPVLDASDERKVPMAFRPANYGRALIFRMDDGFVDAKGVGLMPNTLQPAQWNHGTGTLHLSDAMREVAFERLVRFVFAHAGFAMPTVRPYAVLYAGFDAYFPDGTASPAGIVVRQAYPRAQGFKSLLGLTVSTIKAAKLEGFGAKEDETKRGSDFARTMAARMELAEAVLRDYGIYVYDGRPNPLLREGIEGANIQNTAGGAMVDFAHFRAFPSALKDFQLPFATSGKEGFLPPLFTAKPLPGRAIPFDIWGSTGHEPKYDSKFDNPWKDSLAIADARNSDTKAWSEYVETKITATIDEWSKRPELARGTWRFEWPTGQAPCAVFFNAPSFSDMGLAPEFSTEAQEKCLGKSFLASVKGAGGLPFKLTLKRAGDLTGGRSYAWMGFENEKEIGRFYEATKSRSYLLSVSDKIKVDSEDSLILRVPMVFVEYAAALKKPRQ